MRDTCTLVVVIRSGALTHSRCSQVADAWHLMMQPPVWGMFVLQCLHADSSAVIKLPEMGQLATAAHLLLVLLLPLQQPPHHSRYAHLAGR
jgi:hypothetical protein